MGRMVDGDVDVDELLMAAAPAGLVVLPEGVDDWLGPALVEYHRQGASCLQGAAGRRRQRPLDSVEG